MVFVPAGTEIYVVLQKPAKESKENIPNQAAKAGVQPSARQVSAQELRQLLQLQRELNRGAPVQGASQ